MDQIPAKGGLSNMIHRLGVKRVRNSDVQKDKEEESEDGPYRSIACNGRPVKYQWVGLSGRRRRERERERESGQANTDPV